MLLAYYCDTQKRSSREFAEFIGKKLCQSPFLTKLRDDHGDIIYLPGAIKKEPPAQCSLRTLLNDWL